MYRKWMLITTILLTVLLAGCEKAETPQITSVEQLNHKSYSVGSDEGSAGMFDVEAYLPEAELMLYSSSVTGYAAVQQGELDAYAYDRIMMEFAIANGLEGVRLLDGGLGEGMDIAVGISPKTEIPGLTQKVNAFLQELRQDGTLEDMYHRWVTTADSEMPDIPKAEDPVYHLKVGTTGVVQPFSYYEGTTLTGYDLEMIYRFAYWLNADVEIAVYDYGGIIAAAESGDIDCIMANLNATPERREKLAFSDGYLRSQTAVMVKSEAGSARGYQSAEELSEPGTRLGILTGSVFDALTQEAFPEAELAYYNNIPDMAYSVTLGQLDAFMVDEPVARYMELEYPAVTHIPDLLSQTDYAIAFPKTAEGGHLRDQLNAFMAELEADGTLAQIDDIWFGSDDSRKVIDLSGLTGENGVLQLATNTENPPFSYLYEGQIVGYEIDIVVRFCRAYGYGLELHNMDFSALIPGLGERYDLAASCIAVTAERSESVYFSDPVYSGGTVMMVRGAEEETGFWASLAESFEKTFIRESRWKLIVQGVGTTVLISLLATILGSILGFGLCLLKLSGNPVAKGFAQVYIRVLQGTPMVVLLMILFYLVFAGSGLDGVWVAVIGFGLNLAAYVCEMIRTGIQSVDRGQTEAALALGYTRTRAFLQIVMPQAAWQFLPVFKGEFISLIKMTSVVGYIAVQDLTKMSDIIRSRTYEAFFPLISTAVIYFIIAWLLTSLLKPIERRVQPNRKNRSIKGVNLS
ncbi:MAG: ABC transporter permease subunit [Oscillospiraceae bacterium]|nr:ABC transporter permease subunit [Oscillospiraceae bacterium]